MAVAIGAYDYVPLNRTFAELSSYAGESDDSDLSRAFHVSNDLGWDVLLQDYRIVILSEAGSGKTEEFRTVAARLRASGKDAFFLRLENVPDQFRAAFDVSSANAFEEWLASGREGWLFLDSVDEARLRHPRDFELALRKLGDQLKLALDRTHIFLSGRISAWRPKTDLDHAKASLPYSPSTEVPTRPEEAPDDDADIMAKLLSDDDDGEEAVAADTSVASAITKSAPSTAPFRILTLEKLSRPQVEAFAQARGVSDTKAFGDAIERADAWSFAALPQDLEDLIASWQKREQIGGRLHMMQDGVERRLKERDRDRAETVTLTEEKALEGARILAAAATLCRNPAIQVPDGADGLGGIPVEKVLTDWTPQERKTLLERPIFDAKIYGAVRFHHRTVREFLTAEWLRQILLRPASRRSIESLLFQTQYGVDVVVPVMRPVLPWLALWDSRIRERIRKVAPEVLFEGGDPAALPLPTRREILAGVAQVLAPGHAPNAPTDYAAVQRFAHVDLSDDIRRLLREHANHEEAASFLLRMVWLGQIKAALPEAKQQALLPTAGQYQRIAAIRAVAAVGSPDDLREIREAVLGEAGPPNREWVNALAETIEGHNDEVEWLLRAAARTEAMPKYSVDHLQGGVAKLIERLPLEQLSVLVSGFCRLLSTAPYIDAGYCKISTRYSWLLFPAGAAVERLIEARNPAAMSPAALGILGMLTTARRFDSDVRELKADFSKLVPAWPECNRALFWSEVARARGDRTVTMHGRVTQYWQAHSFEAFWTVGSQDFDYFVCEIAKRTEQDDKLVALSAAFDGYARGGRAPATRKRLKDAVTGNQELMDRLELCLHPPKRADDAAAKQSRKWKRQSQARARQEKENLQKARDYMRGHLAALRDPRFPNPNDISRNQWYLHQRARDKAEQKGKWTTGNWRSLMPEFGEEIAAAYRDGAILHWRHASPQLRSEGAEANQTTASAIFGLTGLAIDARETPHWVEGLGPEDVARAWRFAAHELNGFPEWLPRVYAAHPLIVADLIMEEVSYELSAEPAEGMHYVIDDLAWAGKWAWKELGPRILTMLQAQEPRNDETLNKLLRVLLSSGVPDADIAALAQAKLAGAEGRHPVQWFAVWTGIDPASAIPAFVAYLEKLSANRESVDAAMSYVTHLFGDRYSDYPVGRNAFKEPRYLEQLYLLMHRHIHRSEDIDRANGEAYTPTLRDRAQNSRDAIFNLLNATAGKEAYIAMTAIAKAESATDTRRWIEYRAHQRAEQDSDMAAWSPEQVREFNDMQERTPANHRQLAELAINHLLDLKADIEDGDTSIAQVILGISEEEVMRNYLGHELERMSSGRYHIPQEEELADAKRPDLRFHGTNISGPVPTELKIADKWTGPKLFERLENQLSGDYLRDRRSSRGVFLLVNRGKERNRWQIADGTLVVFDRVVAALQEHWSAMSPKYTHIEELTVIGIDLTKRAS